MHPAKGDTSAETRQSVNGLLLPHLKPSFCGGDICVGSHTADKNNYFGPPRMQRISGQELFLMNTGTAEEPGR